MQLAEALSLTDKAVSKWERGLCLPDSTTLPKLAGLLDTDLGSLIPDVRKTEPWQGLLILNEDKTDPCTQINGKPLIHYLLSYFLLLGISDVTIVSKQYEKIDQMDLPRYGLNIKPNPVLHRKTFVIHGNTLLFGSYLTNQLLNMMATGEEIIPVIDEIDVPFLFTHRWEYSLEEHLTKAKRRSLYRGMINIPLDTDQQLQDAETLIQIYERNHHVNYCDLSEIAKNRGLIR